MPKILLTSLVGALVLLAQIWTDWPDQHVHLITCDVGQGDAILVTAGFNQILIDGGRSDEQVLSCLEEYLPFWDRTIEVLVATHMDADHIGGLDSVLENYQVKTIYSYLVIKETETFSDLKQAIEQELTEGAILKKPILGQQIRFSQESNSSNWIKKDQRPEIKFSIISPQEEQLQLVSSTAINPETLLSDINQVLGVFTEEEINHNDLSIVAFLELGQIEVLLTGDLEHQGELALIQDNMLKDIDILKVGHHGAKTSTSEEFLQQVRPEISLVSVGKNNSYNHPSLEVMDDLIQFESEVLRTDELGTIEIITNGEDYWLAESPLLKF